MRILTVLPALGIGGVDRVAQTLSIEYARLGHDVRVLAYREGGEREAPLAEGGVPVFIGGDEIESAVQQADQFDPEIIQIHRGGAYNPVEEALLKRLRTGARRVVETSHFGRVDYKTDPALFDVHLHLSRWCIWRWRKWLGGRARSTCGAIIPNPVDTDAFTPPPEQETLRYRKETLGLPDDAFLLGRVARPSAPKWHPALLQAFRGVAESRPEVHLLLVGAPDEFQAIAGEFPDAVRSRIHFRPCVSGDQELSRIYGALDLFVHAASCGETFGLVIAEAMLCGTPVVTMATPHKDNSQPEVVQHGRNGYVALSPAALEEALSHALANPDELAAMRAVCRESITERFNVQRVVQKTLRVFDHVLTTPREQLQESLDNDPEIDCDASDAHIQESLRVGFGAPSKKELALLTLVTKPLIYRCYYELMRAKMGQQSTNTSELTRWAAGVAK